MGQVASEAIYFGDQKKDLWFPSVRMGGVLAKQSPTKKRIDIDTKLRSLRASKIHPLFLVNKTPLFDLQITRVMAELFWCRSKALSGQVHGNPKWVMS